MAIKTAKQIQKIDSRTAKWVASDVLRELTSQTIQKRLHNKIGLQIRANSFMGNAQKPVIYLILGVVQAAHSAEEYMSPLPDQFPIVTGYIHNLTGFFHVLRMSQQTFVVLNIAIIIFLLSISPLVFQNRHWALRVAKVVAVIEVINGLIHISPAIYFGSYFPGKVVGAPAGRSLIFT